MLLILLFVVAVGSNRALVNRKGKPEFKENHVISPIVEVKKMLTIEVGDVHHITQTHAR